MKIVKECETPKSREIRISFGGAKVFDTDSDDEGAHEFAAVPELDQGRLSAAEERFAANPICLEFLVNKQNAKAKKVRKQFDQSILLPITPKALAAPENAEVSRLVGIPEGHTPELSYEGLTFFANLAGKHFGHDTDHWEPMDVVKDVKEVDGFRITKTTGTFAGIEFDIWAEAPFHHPLLARLDPKLPSDTTPRSSKGEATPSATPRTSMPAAPPTPGGRPAPIRIKETEKPEELEGEGSLEEEDSEESDLGDPPLTYPFPFQMDYATELLHLENDDDLCTLLEDQPWSPAVRRAKMTSFLRAKLQSKQPDLVYEAMHAFWEMSVNRRHHENFDSDIITSMARHLHSKDPKVQLLCTKATWSVLSTAKKREEVAESGAVKDLFNILKQATPDRTRPPPKNGKMLVSDADFLEIYPEIAAQRFQEDQLQAASLGAISVMAIDRICRAHVQRVEPTLEILVRLTRVLPGYSSEFYVAKRRELSAMTIANMLIRDPLMRLGFIQQGGLASIVGMLGCSEGPGGPEVVRYAALSLQVCAGDDRVMQSICDLGQQLLLLQETLVSLTNVLRRLEAKGRMLKEADVETPGMIKVFEMLSFAMWGAAYYICGKGVAVDEPLPEGLHVAKNYLEMLADLAVRTEVLHYLPAFQTLATWRMAHHLASTLACFAMHPTTAQQMFHHSDVKAYDALVQFSAPVYSEAHVRAAAMTGLAHLAKHTTSQDPEKQLTGLYRKRMLHTGVFPTVLASMNAECTDEKAASVISKCGGVCLMFLCTEAVAENQVEPWMCVQLMYQLCFTYDIETAAHLMVGLWLLLREEKVRRYLRTPINDSQLQFSDGLVDFVKRAKTATDLRSMYEKNKFKHTVKRAMNKLKGDKLGLMMGAIKEKQEAERAKKAREQLLNMGSKDILYDEEQKAKEVAAAKAAQKPVRRNKRASLLSTGKNHLLQSTVSATMETTEEEAMPEESEKNAEGGEEKVADPKQDEAQLVEVPAQEEEEEGLQSLSKRDRVQNRFSIAFGKIQGMRKNVLTKAQAKHVSEKTQASKEWWGLELLLETMSFWSDPVRDATAAAHQESLVKFTEYCMAALWLYMVADDMDIPPRRVEMSDLDRTDGAKRDNWWMMNVPQRMVDLSASPYVVKTLDLLLWATELPHVAHAKATELAVACIWNMVVRRRAVERWLVEHGLVERLHRILLNPQWPPALVEAAATLMGELMSEWATSECHRADIRAGFGHDGGLHTVQQSVVPLLCNRSLVLGCMTFSPPLGCPKPQATLSLSKLTIVRSGALQHLARSLRRCLVAVMHHHGLEFVHQDSAANTVSGTQEGVTGQRGLAEEAMRREEEQEDMWKEIEPEILLAGGLRLLRNLSVENRLRVAIARRLLHTLLHVSNLYGLLLEQETEAGEHAGSRPGSSAGVGPSQQAEQEDQEATAAAALENAAGRRWSGMLNRTIFDLANCTLQNLVKHPKNRTRFYKYELKGTLRAEQMSVAQKEVAVQEAAAAAELLARSRDSSARGSARALLPSDYNIRPSTAMSSGQRPRRTPTPHAEQRPASSLGFRKATPGSPTARGSNPPPNIPAARSSSPALGQRRPKIVTVVPPMTPSGTRSITAGTPSRAGGSSKAQPSSPEVLTLPSRSASAQPPLECEDQFPELVASETPFTPGPSPGAQTRSARDKLQFLEWARTTFQNSRDAQDAINRTLHIEMEEVYHRLNQEKNITAEEEAASLGLGQQGGGSVGALSYIYNEEKEASRDPKAYPILNCHMRRPLTHLWQMRPPPGLPFTLNGALQSSLPLLTPLSKVAKMPGSAPPMEVEKPVPPTAPLPTQHLLPVKRPHCLEVEAFGELREDPLRIRLIERHVERRSTHFERDQIEAPPPAAAPWKIEHSVFRPRAREAECRSFWNKAKFLGKMFQVDWARNMKKEKLRISIQKEYKQGYGGTKALDEMKAVQDLKEVVEKYYRSIVRLFDYYSVLGSGDPFHVQLNAYSSFLEECNIGDQESESCKRSDLDTLFILANYTADKTSKLAKCNDEHAFMRFEMLEVIIRISMAKYGKGESPLNPGQCFTKIMEEDILPRLPASATTDRDDYRNDRLYCEPVAEIIKRDLKLLQALYSRYRLPPRSGGVRPKWMRMDGWDAIVQRASLLDDKFTLQESRLIFVMSRMHVSDESEDYGKYQSISFIDFLEAISRTADLRWFPTTDELAEAGYKEGMWQWFRSQEVGDQPPATLPIPRRPSAESAMAPKTRPLAEKLEIFLEVFFQRLFFDPKVPDALYTKENLLKQLKKQDKELGV
ncbi:hypothetical protein CYMTET_16108 [Cymbomonas tetramitiformis]|uniref:Uncharacterized protein n=1 Tax=Cymbomonas tetramitiformis TaxID=36881 RepID=A0AAE0L8C2_9CHLO|nr:hypothetical protein CYMTET_16108 [Cymbomonas tetramitiformis]